MPAFFVFGNDGTSPYLEEFHCASPVRKRSTTVPARSTRCTKPGDEDEKDGRGAGGIWPNRSEDQGAFQSTGFFSKGRGGLARENARESARHHTCGRPRDH